MVVIYIMFFGGAVAAAICIASEVLRIYDARKRSLGLAEYGPPSAEDLDQVKLLAAGSFQLGGSSSAASRHVARPVPQTRLRSCPVGSEEGLTRAPATSVASWRAD